MSCTFCCFGETPVCFTTIKFTAVSNMKAVCPCSEKTHLTHRPCPRGLSLAGSSLRRLLLGIFPRPLLSVLPDSPDPPDHSLYTSPRPVTAVKARGRRSRGPRHSPRELDTCDGAISTRVETRTRFPQDLTAGADAHGTRARASGSCSSAPACAGALPVNDGRGLRPSDKRMRRGRFLGR